MKNKIRIDQLLLEKGLFESRSKAQAALLSGIIYIGEEKIDKAGKLVASNAEINIRGDKSPYVSRGGEKLAHALKEFKVSPKGKICIDIGASTGGFTDCLLQNGAKQVYCVDVGYGQLAWKLQKNPQVIIHDRMNARNLKPQDIFPSNTNQKADLVVMDVSFISITKILPAVYNLIGDNGQVICLVKPQFEAGREQVEKGGLVKNPEVHQAVLNRVKNESQLIGFEIVGESTSPIRGRDGNIEFLINLIKHE